MRALQTSEPGIPLVRLNLIAPFVDALRQRRVDPTPTLQAFNLNEEALGNPDIFVPAQIVYELVEAFAAAANDSYLGITLGEQLDISSWSPFVAASAQADNTAELLLLCAVNASKDASSASLNLETTGERTRFHVRRLAGTHTLPAQVDAFWIGILAGILKRVTGSDWRPSEVLAQVCDTAVIPADYRGIRVAAGGLDGPSVSFPSSWLFLPFTSAKYTNKPQTKPSSLPGQSFVSSVQQALLPHITEQNLGLARAAQLCGLNKRTLQKHLQNAGTSCSKVLSGLRSEKARAELGHSQKSIAAIGADVGYPDPAVFSRAFKSWTGVSPQRFRKENSV
jgi:AraC-like DNA-binding protein